MGDRRSGLERAASAVGYASPARYEARAGFLFQDLDLAGAHVLDVGCGRGAFSLWPALHGAARVLAIEPETAGSSSGTLAVLRDTVAALGLADVVEPRPALLQDVAPDDGPFDVAVLYNVVNHIDEEAVAALPADPAAWDAFVAVFAHLRGLVRAGGTVIVADAARWNLWGTLGLRAPLSPSIEWHKHAEPEVWAALLGAAGFALHDVRWSGLWPLPRLTARRAVQRATASHFVLRAVAR